MSDVESIFHEVADLPPEERGAALDRLCGGDAALRARVEALLEEDGRATVGVLRTARADEAEIGERIGDVIDRYRLEEALGEGGFGVVYRAAQIEPVRRDVAVKIVKLGMDTRRVVSRFEAERQMLALMDHPGVARVLDAGATPTGRPYFVMDLVRGRPITEDADGRRLDTGARLRLFLAVCDAVQHAHQKGLIHRDLKPTNILVTEVNGAPAPRVIDFGIARAVEHREGAGTFTERGQVIGTPDYMAPEQASGDDVDTRADIYALGVILHELLTGALPRARTADGAEIERPSATVLGTADARTSEARGAPDRRALARRLRGDLDWIILRALEPERSRRYASVGDLAEDIRRHLRSEPVLAGPPSATYRLQRFIVRRRWPLAAAGVVGLALLVGAVAAGVGFVRATDAEALARGAEAMARESEAEARTQAARAVAVRDFLVDTLRSADPETALGREFTVRELLDQAAVRVGGDLEHDPIVAASLHSVIGSTYRSLDRFDDAEPHLRRTLELREGALGPRDPETLDAMQDVAELLEARGRYDEAEEVCREALAIRVELHGERSAEAGASLYRLGQILQRKGKLPEAAEALEQSLSIRREALTAPNAELATAIDGLGRVYDAMARDEEAEALLREALDMRVAVYGERHPFTASTANNLASVLHDMRRHDEAEALYLRALGIHRAVYKGDHTVIARTLNNLASLHQDRGDLAGAEPLFVESLEMRRRLYPTDHTVVANAVNNLAALRFALRDYTAAEAGFREVVEIRRRTVGTEHAEYARSLSSLAASLNQLGRYDDALALLDESLAVLESALGPSHPALCPVLHNCGEVRVRLGLLGQAAPFYRRSLELHAASPAGAGSPHALQSWFALADCHAALGEEAEARAVLADARPLMLAYSGRAGVAHRTLSKTADLAARLGDDETADALRRRLEELSPVDVAPSP